MSIEAMKQALEALDCLIYDKPYAGRFADALIGLRTAIQQAESEPVAFGIRESSTGRICQFVSSDDEDEVAQLGEYRKGIVAPLYTHPAPGVPGALKDHQIAALVNKVRDIARMFHGHQSLRERIAIELVPALKASQDVQSNAERWIYAIADGGNQSMNFIDIFDDWDGDGDFVEVFDAAMLAAKDSK